MIVGYGRTSTTDQVAGLDAQQRDLAAAGCEKLFIEHASAKDTNRPQLGAALDFVREGDTFTITKIDRLARSALDLLTLIDRLKRQGVALHILSFGGQSVKAGTAHGDMMLTMMAGFAQFERALMLERQVEGIAAARAAGKYKGRAPTARRQSAEIIRLKDSGLGASEIAERLRIGRASVYRVLAPPEAAD